MLSPVHLHLPLPSNSLSWCVLQVGTSNFFWSLPSDAANKRRKRRAELEAQAPDARAKRERLEAEVAAQKKARPATAEREAALRELEEAQRLSADLTKELGNYAAADPKHLEKVLETSSRAHDAANRWTDNIFLLKQYLEKAFGRGEQIDALFKREGAMV